PPATPLPRPLSLHDALPICIGAPLAINAAFCFHTSYDPASRLYDPALGGGALFDVGVYALGFALDMAGRAPDAVNGMLHLCPGGDRKSTRLNSSHVSISYAV